MGADIQQDSDYIVTCPYCRRVMAGVSVLHLTTPRDRDTGESWECLACPHCQYVLAEFVVSEASR